LPQISGATAKEIAHSAILNAFESGVDRVSMKELINAQSQIDFTNNSSIGFSS